MRNFFGGPAALRDSELEREMSEKVYSSTVEEDPKTGDIILPLPEELLSELGWNEQTYLVWEVEEGRVILREVTDDELIETVPV